MCEEKKGQSVSSIPRASANALHTPVMVDRCLELLAPAIDNSPHDQPLLIDATVGMGGHSEAILQRFPSLHVLGIDRDPNAIALASERLASFGPRFRAYHGTYDQLAEALAHTYGEREVDAVFFDLGMSSLHIDEVERGFSYMADAPLDMRMDPSSGPRAADLLANLSEKDLAAILKAFGDERYARGIARAIVRRRQTDPITTTGELAQLVEQAIPAAAQRTGGHPAKRTFQALRIAVNEELEILTRAIPAALAATRVGGRVVVEAYQSLEDRVVKRIFSRGSQADVPEDLPFVPADAEARLRLVTRGAERASDEEIAANSRSAPVRLRAVELIRPWSRTRRPIVSQRVPKEPLAPGRSYRIPRDPTLRSMS